MVTIDSEQGQLRAFYREYCDLDEDLEIWQFAERYTKEHAWFAVIMAASTKDDRRQAFNAVQLEMCRTIERHGLYADLMRFFDVTYTGELMDMDVLGRLKEIAQDQRLSDKRRRQAIRLLNRTRSAGRARG